MIGPPFLPVFFWCLLPRTRGDRESRESDSVAGLAEPSALPLRVCIPGSCTDSGEAYAGCEVILPFTG